MAEDGKVVYKVKADSKDAVSEAQTAGEKMGSALKSAAAGIGKAFVASAAAATAAAAAIAVSVGKASIQSYADYEQLAGGVETLFKDSANVVKGYADAAYKTAGMSANAYMETVTSFSASLLQSLGGDTAAAAEAANSAVVDMSDNANKMGTSIESIQYAYQGFAKQNYTMLDNLKLGYGGTKEEMQRLLKDAQKLSGQKYDISSLNDVYEAVHVVQTELGITGTTAKEASETISGSASAMKSSWGNLMTAFSSDGWDIDVYLENFIDSVITFGENLVPHILSLAPNLIYGIAELATALIPYVMESAQTILQQIIDVLIAGVPQLFEIATQIIQMLVDGISSNLGNIADVAAELLLSFVDMIVSMLPQIITLATDLVLTLAGALINNIDQIIESGLELLLALIQGLVENFPKLVDATFVLIEKLIGAIINNLPKIIEMGIKIVLSLIAGLLQAIPRLALAVPKLIASIISAFTNTNWSSLGKNIIDGIGKGISDGWKWLVDSVSNLASSLFNTAKRALGIKSPSKKFKYIGEMSMEGTKKGFEDEAPDLNRTVSTLYSSAATAAHGSLQKNSGFLGANMRENVEKNISFSMSATATTPNQSIEVPVYLNGREIARASAWNMGEQLAWEEL